MTDNEKIERLIELLRQVRDDATGDVNDMNKRVWPIRSSLYRQIVEEVGRVDWAKDCEDERV